MIAQELIDKMKQTLGDTEPNVIKNHNSILRHYLHSATPLKKWSTPTIGPVRERGIRFEINGFQQKIRYLSEILDKAISEKWSLEKVFTNMRVNKITIFLPS